MLIRLAILIFCHAKIAFAKDKYSIALPIGTGTDFYQELLVRTLKNDPMEIIKAPLKRAATMFGQNKTDCFFGADNKALKLFYNLEGIESDRVLEFGIGAYTLKEMATVKSILDLKGKHAVTLNGISFGPDLKTQFELSQLTFVNADEQMLAMMRQKRVDVAFFWYPLKKTYLGIHREKTFSLFHANLTLVCKPNSKSEKIITKFNQGLKQLRTSGWLEKEFEVNFADSKDYL